MDWYFITLMIIILVVGFTIAFAPIFFEIFRDKDKYVTPDDVRRIFHEEMNKLKSNPS